MTKYIEVWELFNEFMILNYPFFVYPLSPLNYPARVNLNATRHQLKDPISLAHGNKIKVCVSGSHNDTSRLINRFNARLITGSQQNGFFQRIIFKCQEERSVL